MVLRPSLVAVIILPLTAVTVYGSGSHVVEALPVSIDLTSTLLPSEIWCSLAIFYNNFLIKFATVTLNLINLN